MLSLRPLPALRPVHQESVQCGYEKRVKKEKVSKPRNNFSTEYCEALHSLLSQSMIGEREKRARNSRKQNARIDILKKASIKTTDVSNVAPISPLADEYQHFGSTCSLNLYTEDGKHKSPKRWYQFTKIHIVTPQDGYPDNNRTTSLTQHSERVCDNLVF